MSQIYDDAFNKAFSVTQFPKKYFRWFLRGVRHEDMSFVRSSTVFHLIAFVFNLSTIVHVYLSQFLYLKILMTDDFSFLQHRGCLRYFDN